ncbi:ABC transporter sub-family A-like protein 11 [Sarcoptes scabiei]|uniref:ABC transporter sub-family A-like protein 11 n=1 Tax=Sarcoptes scabiei TaxID=52283 RepID=A0A132AAX2_SARSC|nr:ABC transporter sub-family A-like protein 11 [Sarcoptes scabiei]
MFNIIRPHFQRFNQWIQMTPAEGQSSSIDTGGDCGGQHRHMYAAIVTDLVYHYGRGKKSCNALNGITIKVPVGTIYAILGPSGCGKTTLVHSLVGSIKPKSGYVKVFGEIPGSPRSLVPGPGVGYMPQEIGLFDEFTIKETLFFFGRLYRLKKDTIRNRIEFLISFLELPDKNCFVGKLSGGQKRRVSLASALVHKPPLLVLDEPTVGVDPVLRQSIWRHLRSLSSQEGITIIITTHYIDEAQYANTVAFMRHGILLEEGNPQQLIEQSGLNNLEEVFLALCNCKERKNLFDRKISCEKIQSSITIKSDFDRANSIETNLDNKAQNLHGNKFDDQPKTNRLLSSDNSKIYHSQTYRIQEYSGPIQLNEISYHGDSFTNRIRPQVVQRLLMKRNKILDHFARSSALLTKNFIRMWRTLFFLCLGRNPYDIPISVYNGEIDPTYSNIFNRTKLDNLYSRLLLDEIDNHTINLVFVDTLEQGLMAVRSGQTKGLISFRPNFTRATFEKSVDFMSLTVENLEESFIDLHLDMSCK